MKSRLTSFILLLMSGIISHTYAQSGPKVETALTQMMEGNFALAQKTATEVISSDANNGLAYMVRGAGRLVGNDQNAAQVDFEKAVKISPDNGIFNGMLADCYRIQKNTAGAKKYAEKTITLLRTPKSTMEYFARALANAALEKREEAVADYTRAIELNPRFVRAYAKRGLIYYNNNQPDLAHSDFSKAIEVNPRYGVLYFYRGNIYLEQQKLEQAIGEYTKSVELDPLDGDVWFNRAVCYKKLGKYDLALADYAKAIALSPKDVDVYNNRGHVYFLQEQYDQALADYTKAIELNPTLPGAYVFRGNTYRRKDQLELAIKDHDKAIELNPKYVDAYMERGYIYYYDRQLDPALKDFNKAIELDPKYANAYLYAAFAQHDKQQYNQAITNYTKSIELWEKNPDAYLNRAEAYEAIGNSKQADLDRKKGAELGGKITASSGSTRKSIFPAGTFDPALAKAALARGLSTIKGIACTRVDGGVFDARGVTVYLYPVTPYLEEWYDLRDKKEGKKTGVYMSTEANLYRIKAVADRDGRFVFEGLKPGKYFIQLIHSFNQAKTKRVYTGSDVSQNGPVRTTTDYYYDHNYTVARSRRLEKFVEIKEDGDVKKITIANGLIKSCVF
jgi:tetratricopeptide (TPR) repeat protein